MLPGSLLAESGPPSACKKGEGKRRAQKKKKKGKSALTEHHYFFSHKRVVSACSKGNPERLCACTTCTHAPPPKRHVPPRRRVPRPRPRVLRPPRPPVRGVSSPIRFTEPNSDSLLSSRQASRQARFAGFESLTRISPNQGTGAYISDHY